MAYAYKPRNFKIDRLVKLFDKIGKKVHLLDVYKLMGFNIDTGYYTLSTYVTVLKNTTITRPDRIMTLSITKGYLVRKS